MHEQSPYVFGAVEVAVDVRSSQQPAVGDGHVRRVGLVGAYVGAVPFVKERKPQLSLWWQRVDVSRDP